MNKYLKSDVLIDFNKYKSLDKAESNHVFQQILRQRFFSNASEMHVACEFLVRECARGVATRHICPTSYCW